MSTEPDIEYVKSAMRVYLDARKKARHVRLTDRESAIALANKAEHDALQKLVDMGLNKDAVKAIARHLESVPSLLSGGRRIGKGLTRKLQGEMSYE